MDNNKNGVLYIILSSISFGIIPILAKLAYSGGANTYSVLFLRFIFASLIILYYLIKKGISLKLGKEELHIVILLGIFGYGGTAICLFLSYNYITVGLATMILYLYPSLVTFLSFVIYQERLYGNKIVSLIISLLGMYMLIGIGSKNIINTTGIFFAVLASLCYSGYVIGISHSKVRNINSYVMIFYVSIISSVLMLCMGLATKSLDLRVSFYSLVCILLLAFISTVIALMTFLQGVKLIGPSKASIFSNLEPIVSVALGYLVLKEQITIRLIIGSIMVILSVVILALERKTLNKLLFKVKHILKNS